MTNSKGRKRRVGSKSFASITKCTDPRFLDFIDRCLCWDPRYRLKPHEALMHPFISDFCLKNTQSSVKPKTNPVQKNEKKIIRKYPSATYIPSSSKKSDRDHNTTRGALPSVASSSLDRWKNSFMSGLAKNHQSKKVHQPSTYFSTTKMSEPSLPPISLAAEKRSSQSTRSTLKVNLMVLVLIEIVRNHPMVHQCGENEFFLTR